MIKYSEKFLEDKLTKFYQGDFNVVNQAKLTQKRIDILLMSQKKEIWAIEVKIKDWKTAVRQATLNMLGADRSYIAIWHKYANSALKQRKMLKKIGIGLIIINERFEPQEKFFVRNSSNINPIAYSYLNNHFYEQ